jgi:hypothetical protein
MFFCGWSLRIWVEAVVLQVEGEDRVVLVVSPSVSYRAAWDLSCQGVAWVADLSYLFGNKKKGTHKKIISKETLGIIFCLFVLFCL